MDRYMNRKIAKNKKISQRILKYSRNRRMLEYIKETTNLKYNDVIEEDQNLIAWMVHHKIHYRKLVEEVIAEGVDFMIPVSKRKIVRNKKIFKRILKYSTNRRMLEYIIKSNNLKYNDVIEGDENLIARMVHHKIHYRKLIEEAIAEGVDFMIPVSKRNPDFLAVAVFKASEIDSIRAVLKHIKDSHVFLGQTLLHWLTEVGLPDVFIEALEIVGDVNVRNNKMQTPLHQAVQKNNLDIARILLNNGADVNAVDTAGDICLHCVSGTTTDMLRLLLQYHPKVDCMNYDSITPLMGLFIKMVRNVKVDADNIGLLLMAGAGFATDHKILKNLLSETLFVTDYPDCLIELMKCHRLLTLNKTMLLFIFKATMDQLEGNKDMSFYDYFNLESLRQRKWKDFIETIHQSINVMKQAQLGNTSLVLWDIAVAPVDRVVSMFSNKRLMRAALQNDVTTCITLDTMVKNKIELVCQRRNFVNACIPYIEEIELFPLPRLCLEVILEYLDYETLRNILVCYTQITGNPVHLNALFENPSQ